MEQGLSDSLYYIWFAIFVIFLAILFVAKLKFDKIFTKRQERRRMLSYSRVKLTPNEEGLNRSLKVRKAEAEQPPVKPEQSVAPEQSGTPKQ
jgi:Na+/H+ antiporter NhaC